MVRNVKEVLVFFGVAALLSACSFSGNNRAPVEEARGRVAIPPIVVAKPPPLNARFADKPGYYTVVSGDTLFSIARKHAQGVPDLIAWNQLSDPNLIEVGDVLRIFPPAAISKGVNLPGSGTTVESKPTPKPMPTPEQSIEVVGVTEVEWSWPATGNITQVFDETKKSSSGVRGINIDNVLGSPVFAAADGVVAVTGRQRGYGDLVVIKHDNDFISAYAHNQVVLVKEGDAVKRAQKIATMGAEDTDRPRLHFQIRKKAKPVDPLLYLPRR